MKKTIIGIVACTLAMATYAELFKVDTGHSGIGFSVRHMMVSNTRGSFNKFDGTLDYDIAGKTLKSIEGWIDASSIDTNNEKRDRHLRNEDFFNVAKFAKLTFRSTSVEKTGENQFMVAGKLNVLGIDRDVELPVSVAGLVEGRQGSTLIGVDCSTVLDRRHLGITYGPAAMIGNEVKIEIACEAVYK